MTITLKHKSEMLIYTWKPVYPIGIFQILTRRK